MIKEILILTTRQLTPAFQEYIRYKSEQGEGKPGFTVKCLTVEEIPGWNPEKTPAEKAELIKTQVMNQVPAKSYVIIGGKLDDVPSFIYHTDGKCFYVSDCEYAKRDNGSMTFSISRIPFNNVNDISMVCDNFIGYMPKEWGNILLVADSSSIGADNFVESMKRKLQIGTVATMKRSNIDKGGDIEDIKRLEDNIINFGLIFYTGHANPLYWNYSFIPSASLNGGVYFDKDKIPPLPLLPNILCFACGTSAFQIPKNECIGADFLRKGAVNYWGASYISYQSCNRAMMGRAIDCLNGNHAMTVGELQMEMMNYLISMKRGADVKQYLLFGDPTLQMFRQ